MLRGLRTRSVNFTCVAGWVPVVTGTVVQSGFELVTIAVGNWSSCCRSAGGMSVAVNWEGCVVKRISSVVLAWGVGVMLLQPARAVEPINLGDQRELMFDGHLFSSVRGLSFRQHRPVEREKTLDFSAPWEGRRPFGFSVTGYATVLTEPGRFRMYYASWYGHRLKPGDPEQQFTGYCESRDGIHWERPKLGRVQFDGNKQNNILFQGGSISHNFAPFIDTRPGVPDDEKYKAVGGNGKAYVFGSPDGIEWRKLREMPIVDGTEKAFDRYGAIHRGNNPANPRAILDSHNLAFWDSARGRYVFFFRAHLPALDRAGREVKGTVRSVMMCTSKDFREWSGIRPIDLGVPRQAWRTGLYTTSLQPYPRAPHMLVGFPLLTIPRRPFKGDSFGMSETGLMYSRDGERFTLADESLMPPGRDMRNWTKHGNMFAWGLTQTADDELSMYYHQHDHQSTMHLKRATIRVDGFVSLHAGRYPGGEAISRPLVFSGNELELNVATGAGGGVRVGLVDAVTGQVIPGLEASDEFYGDQVAHVVHWDGKKDLSKVAGRVVRLKLTLYDADLYSLRFRP
ncbi:MAG TPA: hypothetical protein DCE43_10650 [Planctomycetaceae bacterium]|nr:hypothetical protein [Planctomycetaceae bacterium]